MQHPRFVRALQYRFIAEAYPRGFRSEDVPHDDPVLLICVAAVLHAIHGPRRRDHRPAARPRAQGGARLGRRHARRASSGDGVNIANGQHVAYKGEAFTVLSDWAFDTPFSAAR